MNNRAQNKTCRGQARLQLDIYLLNKLIITTLHMFWNVNLFRYVKIIVARITNIDVKIVF